MNKKAIFTCNIGGYDNDPQPPTLNKDWTKILLSDVEPPKHKFDEFILLDKTDRPDLLSKQVKWQPHIFLPNYDLYCWYDSNMKVVRELPPKPFRIIHPRRKNIKEELDACIRQNHRWSKESLEAQYKFMLENGLQDKVGLFLNGFHCRENNEIDRLIGDLVVDMLNNFTTRDQIAFPYILEKLNYKYSPNVIKGIPFFNTYIRMLPHKITKPPIYG